ncbi:MAG: 30S ribosomal protein S9 [Patescibacteria group bacterium]
MEKLQTQKNRYIEAVGRRKTSIARVRAVSGTKNEIVVNSKPLHVYFPTKELQNVVNEALKKSGTSQKWSITVKTLGGGIHSQAEAVRHGIARILLQIDETFRKDLKKAGFLKRDPRMKERRKFGLKKARKAPQWSKR